MHDDVWVRAHSLTQDCTNWRQTEGTRNNKTHTHTHTAALILSLSKSQWCSTSNFKWLLVNVNHSVGEFRCLFCCFIQCVWFPDNSIHALSLQQYSLFVSHIQFQSERYCYVFDRKHTLNMFTVYMCSCSCSFTSNSEANRL